MVEIAIPDPTIIVTQLVLIGGLILGAVKWLESKNEKKVFKAKEEALVTANELKKLSEETAREVRSYSDTLTGEITSKINDIDKRLVDMVKTLQRRADLTNGNVQIIRTEIADLEEDLDTIQNSLPINGDVIKTNDLRRVRAKKRRERRRDIEKNRVEQSESFLNRD